MRLKDSKLLFIFIALIINGFSFSVPGQGYVLTHYKSKSGIGHDNVRAIVADSSGFIWMATWDGLTRYDGTDFVNYFHDPADSTSIPYFSVSNVAVDIEDNLWVSTDNGLLSLFDRATEEFRRVRSLGGVMLDDLTFFSPGPDGFVWFLLQKGILRYHPVTKETIFHPWKSDDDRLIPMPHFRYRLTFSENGDPWLMGTDIIEVGTDRDEVTGEYFAIMKGIYTLERLPGRIGTFFGVAGMGRIVKDSEDNVWLAALTGLFRLDRKEAPSGSMVAV